MFRFALMSDLHNEFERDAPPDNPTPAWHALRQDRAAIEGHPDVGPLLVDLKRDKPDLLILAGDIDNGLWGLVYAYQAAAYLDVPVAYVIGNHEPWRMQAGFDGTVQLIRDEAAKMAASRLRVSFLEKDTVVIPPPPDREWLGPTYVLGTFLGTDYALFGDAAAAMAFAAGPTGSKDFGRILDGDGMLTPDGIVRRHLESRAWLDAEVSRIRAADPHARIIIVTHKGPVPLACNPTYLRERDPYAPHCVCDMTQEIERWRPTAWCWGDTHFNVDATLGPTRLLSSQRGYLGEEIGAESYRPPIFEVF